ncbi:MAG: hypothetical protein ACP5NV_06955 [Candidatus Woesearchaeota archaeon]
MNIARLIVMTAVVYSLNGSLDGLVNDNYSSARAAINPYVIEYLINKNNKNYVPKIGIGYEKFEKAIDNSQTRKRQRLN